MLEFSLVTRLELFQFRFAFILELLPLRICWFVETYQAIQLVQGPTHTHKMMLTLGYTRHWVEFLLSIPVGFQGCERFLLLRQSLFGCHQLAEFNLQLIHHLLLRRYLLANTFQGVRCFLVTLLQAGPLVSFSLEREKLKKNSLYFMSQIVYLAFALPLSVVVDRLADQTSLLVDEIADTLGYRPVLKLFLSLHFGCFYLLETVGYSRPIIWCWFLTLTSSRRLTLLQPYSIKVEITWEWK